MEKVRPWCGQPSDRGRLRNRTELLFWFFQSPTAETPAWILKLKTSNDADLRKEVPFDGYKSEISYLTEF